MTRRQRPRMTALMIVGVLSWSAAALAGAERDDAAVSGGTLCATDPRISEQILASHPGADIDGDGSLSKDEVCAHQMRMQRMLVDEVVSTMPADQLLRADVDGDGELSTSELANLKDRLIVTVRPGQDANESELLLQYESPFRSQAAEREDFAFIAPSQFELETAEVSGTVCEPRIGRCVEDVRAGDDAFLLIDVKRAD